MIVIEKKEDCCGCGACTQICPKSCITIEEDSSGFSYPKVDTSNCIGCDLCVRACPFKKETPKVDPICASVARTKDDDYLQNSSSGGIFYELSKTIIDHGGVVFGAAFDESWTVRHTSAKTLDSLKPLLRSKYVQSSIGSTFLHIRDLLKQEKEVLFSGTPCQVAGLKSFLNHEYENLYCVDFYCHGVPSPLVWKKFLDQKFRSKGRNIVDINFRSKKHGWFLFEFCIQYIERKKHRWNEGRSEYNVYMKTLYGDYVRPSCFNCPFRDLHSCADVTLADAWNIVGSSHELNDDRGASLLLVNTPKGGKLCQAINVESYNCSLDEVYQGQEAVRSGIQKPSKYDYFYKRVGECSDITKLINKVTREKGIKSYIKYILNNYGIRRISKDF